MRHSTRLIHLINFLNQRLNWFTGLHHYVRLKKIIWFTLVLKCWEVEKKPVVQKNSLFDWTLAHVCWQKQRKWQPKRSGQTQINRSNMQSEMLITGPFDCVMTLHTNRPQGKIDWNDTTHCQPQPLLHYVFRLLYNRPWNWTFEFGPIFIPHSGLKINTCI